MKNVGKVITSIIITLVMTMVLNMVCMYLLKVPTPYSYGLSAVVAGGIGWLLFKSTNDLVNVIRWAASSWAVSFALGFAYFSIFDPHEAQGMFAIVLFIAPAGGFLGLGYGIYEQIKNKKLRLA